MHAPWPHVFFAEIGIPSAWQCFAFAAPVLVLIIAWHVIAHADQVIEKLFPHWEWEKRMGWLNLRAERQADAFFRWLGYLVQAWLAVALVGIIWGANGLPPTDRWTDREAMGELETHAAALLVCLGFWLVYFGIQLIPNLRKQYETEELEKYRDEQKQAEREYQAERAARAAANLQKTKPNFAVRSGRPRA